MTKLPAQSTFCAALEAHRKQIQTGIQLISNSILLVPIFGVLFHLRAELLPVLAIANEQNKAIFSVCRLQLDKLARPDFNYRNIRALCPGYCPSGHRRRIFFHAELVSFELFRRCSLIGVGLSTVLFLVSAA
jgi:hypothetical protein